MVRRRRPRIREESPILKVSEPGFPEFWAITKHEDVMEIERHPEIFTNAPVPTLAPANRVAAMDQTPVKTLIQMDGDQHKANRNLVNDWFKPGNLKGLQGRIDTLATHSVDRMVELGGRCDFVNDVALHYPLQVILSILGLPADDYPRMLRLTQEMFGAEDPDIARMGEDEAMLHVLLDFVNYFTTLANDRRAHPTDDLASVIANAEIDGEPLADLDMLGHYVIIATAGHDTTSSAIAGGLLALVEHPDQLQLLREHPELIDAAADEIIRYVSPVKHFMRNCQEPFTLHDVTFQPGELLYLSFASANRDEDVFPDAARLDVRRERVEPPRVRLRSALLPRSAPGPHGDPRHLQGAAGADRPHRAGRRTAVDPRVLRRGTQEHPDHVPGPLTCNTRSTSPRPRRPHRGRGR